MTALEKAIEAAGDVAATMDDGLAAEACPKRARPTTSSASTTPTDQTSSGPTTT